MSIDQPDYERRLCNDNGAIVDGECKCDLEYFGDKCQDSLQDIHFAAYLTFIGVYGAFFLILYSLAMRQLQNSIETNKIPDYYKGLQYMYQVVRSPKNFILCLTILFCIIKIVWLAMDPFQLYNYEQRVLERIIAEIVYSILFAIYGILLIVWYAMYDEISYNVADDDQKDNRKMIFKYYKEIMKVRIIIVFIMQLAISTINGVRLGTELQVLLYIFYVILLINFVSFIGEFFVYGRLLQSLIQIQLDKFKVQYVQDTEKYKQEYQSKSKKKTIFQSFNSNSLQSSQQNIKSLNSPNDNNQYQFMPQKLRQDVVIHQIELQENEDQDESDSNIQFVDQIKSPPKLTKQQRNVTFAKTFRLQKQDTQFRQESEKQIQFKPAKQLTITEESVGSENKRESTYQMDSDQNLSCLLSEERIDKLEDIQNLQIYDSKELESQMKSQIKIIKSTKKKMIKNVVISDPTDLNRSRSQSRAQTPNMRSPAPNFGETEKQSMEKQKQLNAVQFQAEMLQQQQNNKRITLDLDKQIITKIQLLIYLGVALEICFIILTLSILFSSLIETPSGTLIYLYISSILQFLSLLVVLKLFRDVKSQTVMNLIWIQKIGSKRNMITQKYMFSIPEEHKIEDDSKIKFEKRINMHDL